MEKGSGEIFTRSGPSAIVGGGVGMAARVVEECQRRTDALAANFEEIVRLSTVTEYAHEADTLQMKNASQSLQENAGRLEHLLLDLKLQALGSDARAVEDDVSSVARRYESLARSNVETLLRIAREIHESLRELEQVRNSFSWARSGAHLGH